MAFSLSGVLLTVLHNKLVKALDTVGQLSYNVVSLNGLFHLLPSGYGRDLLGRGVGDSGLGADITLIGLSQKKAVVNFDLHRRARGTRIADEACASFAACSAISHTS